MKDIISRRRVLACAASLVLTAPLATLAKGVLPAPTGKVVLTVKGQIGAHNQGNTAVLDMAALEALPQTTFTTLTPWENQPIRFTGPLLRDVLALVKAQGQTIRATALNDYRISIPASDAEKFDVIMAVRMNGEPMSVRSRGPIFIVYPFDSRPELKSATYYERSIWQLKSLDIE